MDSRSGKLYVSIDDVPPTWKPYMVEVAPEKLTPLQRSRMRVWQERPVSVRERQEVQEVLPQESEDRMKYRINALWNQFRTQVMHPAAPAKQVREMKLAFFAGVECALNRLGQEMSQGDSLDDPDDERVINEVNRELQEFAADVKTGKA